MVARGRWRRTDLEELSVDTDVGQHHGEAPLQLAHLSHGRAMLRRRMRGGRPVEEMFDAQETRLEEGDGGERRLVQRVVHVAPFSSSALLFVPAKKQQARECRDEPRALGCAVAIEPSDVASPK